MAWDSTSKTLVLFGGHTNGLSGLYADTWEWNGTNWTQVSTAATPVARFGEAMAADAVSGGVVLFGGENDEAVALNDTWVFRQSTGWVKQQSTNTAPLPRTEASLVDAEAFGGDVLFGGRQFQTVFGDTLLWASGFAGPPPPPPPPPPVEPPPQLPQGGGHTTAPPTGTTSSLSNASTASSGTLGTHTAKVSSGQIIVVLLQVLAPSGQGSRIKTLLRHVGITITFDWLEAGSLEIDWYAKPAGKGKTKPILIASGRRTSATIGEIQVHISLTSAGKKLLKHASRAKVTAKGVFTPAGEAPATTLKAFTIKR
jgi:hypothetical protein